MALSMDSRLRRNDIVEGSIPSTHRVSLGLDPRAIRRLCRVEGGPRVEPEGEQCWF